MEKKSLFLLLFIPAMVLLITQSVYGGPQKEFFDLLALSSVVILVGLGFALLTGILMTIQIFLALAFGRVVAKSTEIASQKTIKLAFLGLINTLGMAFLCIVMVSIKHPLTILIGLAIFVTFLAIGLVSLSSTSSYLGKRLLDQSPLAGHPIFCLGVGWLYLAFFLLIPFVGWAIFLYYCFVGLGSTMLAIFQEDKKDLQKEGI